MKATSLAFLFPIIGAALVHGCGFKTNSTGLSLNTWSLTSQLGQASKVSSGFSTVDSEGNIIVVGETNGNMVSCGGKSANCAGNSTGTTDLYVTKYNSSGEWLWTRQLGEASKRIQIASVTVDTQKNIFVAGSTTGELTSCAGVSASCTGSSASLHDMVLVKYDKDGTWLWTQQLGSSGGLSYQFAGYTAKTDSSGNSYITWPVDRDLTSCNGVSASCSGASQGGFDYVITKYNAAGVWQWTRQLGQTGKDTVPFGLEIDSAKNVYIVGDTEGNLVSCAGVSSNCAGSSQGTFDYFISKYDENGNWLWTKQLGETAKVTHGKTLAIDSLDNVYILGSTNGNLSSCSGVSANCSGSSTGNYDYYISKYDSTGNWQWTQQLGASGEYSQGNSAAIDSDNNIYVFGETGGNLASCGSTPASCSGNAAGINDVFITKYSSSGVRGWTRQLGQSALYTYAKSITVSSGILTGTATTQGNLVSCNWVSASCSGNATGSYDVFLFQFTY